MVSYLRVRLAVYNDLYRTKVTSLLKLDKSRVHQYNIRTNIAHRYDRGVYTQSKRNS